MQHRRHLMHKSRCEIICQCSSNKVKKGNGQTSDGQSGRCWFWRDNRQWSSGTPQVVWGVLWEAVCVSDHWNMHPTAGISPLTLPLRIQVEIFGTHFLERDTLALRRPQHREMSHQNLMIICYLLPTQDSYSNQVEWYWNIAQYDHSCVSNRLLCVLFFCRIHPHPYPPHMSEA